MALGLGQSSGPSAPLTFLQAVLVILLLGGWEPSRARRHLAGGRDPPGLVFGMGVPHRGRFRAEEGGVGREADSMPSPRRFCGS